MQIRGEAAIACGFMAGLATGLLFDGCFDSYINRFCDFGFSRGKPWKTAPARQEVAAPIEPRSVDTSKIKVIVTSSLRTARFTTVLRGAKAFLKTPLKQAYH